MTIDIAGETVTLYTIEEVASMLNVTTRTARDYVRKGRIATVLLDRHKVIPAWALRAYLTAHHERIPFPSSSHSGTEEEGNDLAHLWENTETLF